MFCYKQLIHTWKFCFSGSVQHIVFFICIFLTQPCQLFCKSFLYDFFYSNDQNKMKSFSLKNSEDWVYVTKIIKFNKIKKKIFGEN